MHRNVLTSHLPPPSFHLPPTSLPASLFPPPSHLPPPASHLPLPTPQECVVEPLLPHFLHFYEADENATPPLKFEKCARLQVGFRWLC